MNDLLRDMKQRVVCINAELIALHQWLHKNVFTHSAISGEVLEIFDKVNKELIEIESVINDITVQPLRKLTAGQQLSREEFFILSISGWIKRHYQRNRMDAYQEFTHYYYEDDIGGGYINPNIETGPIIRDEHGRINVKISAQWGIMPEDVKVSFLRMEQREYFEKYEPGLLSRFKNE